MLNILYNAYARIKNSLQTGILFCSVNFINFRMCKHATYKPWGMQRARTIKIWHKRILIHCLIFCKNRHFLDVKKHVELLPIFDVFGHFC